MFVDLFSKMKKLISIPFVLLLFLAGFCVNAADEASAESSAPAYMNPESAQAKAVLDLWPEGVPGSLGDAEPEVIYPGGISKVYVPKLYAYPVEGSTDAPAVVIFPGGGYTHLAIEKEGFTVARWLNSLGIAAFVVEYRHDPYRAPMPLMDAQRAIRMVRKDFKKWGIDPYQLGVMGFSAGGHLTATTLTMWDQPVMQEGPYSGVSCRPDFGILAYPVISLVDDSLTHEGSRTALLGEGHDEEARERWSLELHVPLKVPPVLLFHARDDGAVPVGNSYLFQDAVQAVGGSAETFLVDEGGHGFGLYKPEVVEACEAWLAERGFTDQQPEVTVYGVGDSTMADKPTDTDNPERGWGQLLPEFLPKGMVMDNHALNGRSSKSFIDEGCWDAVMKTMKPGDWVIIQFGHNDQKFKDPARYTNPYSGYRANLAKMVADARDRGAHPVLASSIVRRNFNEYGTLEDTHGAYPFVMRQLALELGVPFVDLQLMTEDWIRGHGPEDSKRFFVWAEPGEYLSLPEGKQDNTHLNDAGARKVAGMFWEGWKGILEKCK